MKKHFRTGLLLSALAITGALVSFAACDDSSSAIKEPPPDSGTNPGIDAGPNPGVDGGGGDGGGDGGSGDCFAGTPTTHLEIINACTPNATKVPKNPTLNKLLSDGGLPPLL